MEDINTETKNLILNLWDNGWTIKELESLVLLDQETIKEIVLAWA